MTTHMDDAQLEIFEVLVTSHTGIKLRPRQRELLRKVLQHGLERLCLNSYDDYLRILQSPSPESRSDWNRITHALTNNESYFFRDKGQIALLRDRILPELFARNNSTKTLRVWSAGCSTGEEAYTLSTLIENHLSRMPKAQRSQWEVLVLGTDIDESALIQARRGVYGSWSFRMVEPSVRQRDFYRSQDGWQISDACRSHVQFAQSNLVADPFPSSESGIENMDLILCRNVFIYFDSASVSMVLKKFTNTLRLGGYLMTGHVEILGNKVEHLRTISFPESEIYQRIGNDVADVSSIRHPDSEVPGPLLIPKVDRSNLGGSFLDPMIPQNVREAPVPVGISDFRERTESSSSDTECLDLIKKSRSLADMGKYKEAVEGCHLGIKAAPFAPDPYELLAAIAIELGQFDEAKVWLKKALYLAPTSPLIYLELGNVYRAQGEAVRAERMHLSALELLKDLAPDTLIGPPDGPTASECIRHLTEIIEEAA